jgi:hypothetical protein
MATAGYAIKLNGTTQYMTVADSAHHDYATGNAFTFGVRFWLDYDYDSSRTKHYIFHRANQHSAWIENGHIWYYHNGVTAAVTYDTGIKVVPEHLYQLVITGSESTNTTLKFYIDGSLEHTETMTGELAADTNTILYVGAYYSGSASLFLNGTLCEWFQSNTTAFSAANVVTAYNAGIPDIDTIEAISGVIDNIGFEENTGTTYAGGIAGTVSGAGVGTPVWATYGDLGLSLHQNCIHLSAVGEMYNKQLFVSGLTWEGDAIADGDTLELTDINDNSVYYYIAKTDDTGPNDIFSCPRFWHGLKVKTLGHGSVHVYLK